MLADLRQRAILTQIAQLGSATVSGLAQHFGVSEMNSRRDLMELENVCQFARIDGGAVAASGIAMAAVHVAGGRENSTAGEVR